jgi:ATP-binding cassette, subfamily C (CFTR/MRP), member 4
MPTNKRERVHWSHDPSHPCSSCCSCISFATFSFGKPLLSLGRKLAVETRKAKSLDSKEIPIPLNENDLPKVLDSTNEYQNKLRQNWKIEQQQHPENPKYWRAVLKTFIRWHGIFLVLAGSSRIFGAIFLGYFVEQLEQVTTSPTTTETNWAIVYGFLVILGTWLTSFGHHTYYYYAWSHALKMRIANVGIIYEKTTKLTMGALGDATTGRIFNLAAGDTMRIMFGLMFLPYFVWGPIEALIILGLLVWEIGWAAAIGWLFFVLIFVPLQLYFSRWFAKLQFAAAKAADHRIKLTTEIVTGAGCVKSHCWENAFVKIVDQARSKEVGILKKIATLRGLNEGIYFSSTTVVGAVIFLIHTWGRGLPVKSKNVMVVLQLLLILQLTVAKFLCMAIMGFSQSWISMERIGELLLRTEIVGETDKKTDTSPKAAATTTTTTTTTTDPSKSASTTAIQYSNACARWNASGSIVTRKNQTQKDKKIGQEMSSTVLSKLNITVQRGDFVIVIGPVGCGKTSLLMTLLNELPLETGTLFLHSDLRNSTAYVGQTPYIQSGTVADNITFGAAMNADRFKKVCKACALDTDIRALSNGELTLVGEKGVTLSGGQRARVALARAAYAQANFVLLDDPLSAVDPHVAASLVDNVITAGVQDGGLKNNMTPTTIVLCTHQVQFAERADIVVILGQDGEMIECGSYSDVKNHPALYREGNDDGEQKSANQEENSTKDVELVVEEEETMETMMNKLRSISGDQPIRSLSTTSSIARGNATSFDGGDSKQEEEDRNEVSETRATGIVSWQSYARYLNAGGGCAMFLPLTIMMILGQGLAMFTQYTMTVLAKTSVQLTSVNASATNATATNVETATGPLLPSAQVNDVATILVIFAFLSMCVAMIRSMWFFVALVNGAKNLHKSMLRSVVRAPMYFYNTNPTGRILNRFSADLAFADDQMPQSAFDFVGIGMSVTGTVVLAAVANPFVLVVLMPLVFAFNWLRGFYMDTSREIKRIEALSRSPIFNQLSETLAGIVTLRGFKGGIKDQLDDTSSNSNIIEHSIVQFNEKLDVNSSHFFAFIAAARYFGFRLDFINHAFTASCVAIVLILRFGIPKFGANIIDPNLVGLSILYLMQGGDAFQWCVRQAAEVENMMVSVERISEYISIKPEASLETDKKILKDLPKNWPTKGALTLNKLNLKYSKKGPMVLRNVSLNISAGDKVALVGRTGAGKSSMLSALFRLTEPTSGRIKIDNIDVSTLGLHAARGAISIIPQEPWLFSGTIRRNIDPFKVHSDDDIWNALKHCQLNSVFSSLNDMISESGNNLSTGECQLVCLARALLSASKIIVLDEATANVDQGTDKLIQKTVRDQFKDKTLIVIAHRINTIIDSDQVVVLDAGEVVEQGDPHLLLTGSTSTGGVAKYFASMVEETGEESAKYLRKAAKLSYVLRSKKDK